VVVVIVAVVFPVVAKGGCIHMVYGRVIPKGYQMPLWWLEEERKHLIGTNVGLLTKVSPWYLSSLILHECFVSFVITDGCMALTR